MRGERERDTKTERERERKGRMKPTHLEERRQKEYMTAQHNEIEKSVWFSIHLKNN